MRKVLIANRGEIAHRLVLACRELGMTAVAVYAEPDAEAPHVWLADEAHPLGGHTPGATYLDGLTLIDIARASGCDALHPGYGFLSENAAFAAACAQAGLTFVGPGPEAIAAMGHKLEARRRVEAAGVPVPPGGVIGPDPAGWPAPGDYPVMVKAAGGGGGMGLRRVDAATGFAPAVADARSQCAAAFGLPEPEVELYWESYLEGGRHVEVQIAADATGAVIALGERDCSTQRRYQKVIEESPSAGLSEAQRADLARWAVLAAEAVGYRNLGTVEFLVTPGRGATFLEMNTRLQVEHPVTELVTGLDLPRLQFELAQGRSLAELVPSVERRGHAIEARLYAEDPVTGAPAPGRIDVLRWPTGPWVRVDAGVEAGMTVSPYFDPLLAKIIAWGPDRATAIARLSDALSRTVVAGTLTTNLAGLKAILDDEAFRADAIDTGYLARRHVTPAALPLETAAAAAFLGQSGPAPAEAPVSASNWARRPWR